MSEDLWTLEVKLSEHMFLGTWVVRHQGPLVSVLREMGRAKNAPHVIAVRISWHR